VLFVERGRVKDRVVCRPERVHSQVRRVSEGDGRPRVVSGCVDNTVGLDGCEGVETIIMSSGTI